jgi:D-sedoheptulose 7-phosphate isomerase
MATESNLADGPGGGGAAVPKNFREDAIAKAFYVDGELRTWDNFKTQITSAIDAFEATDDDLQKRAVGARLLPSHGNVIFPFQNAMIRFFNAARETSANGGKVIFVGNGGSAAICSHMAVDWTKNGGIRAIALNDPATLTCFANDYGYDQVFAKQLAAYSDPEDLVVVISSSGRSPNILETGRWCRENGRRTVTLSGMVHTNKLRRMGMINFYVPSNDYGTVELAHLFLLHSIVSVKW